MKIDTVLSPAEVALLPARALGRSTCVVFDVLRATSTITTGLAAGVREFHPVATIEAALALHRDLPETLLSGERGGEKIAGFALGNSPLEFQRLGPVRVIHTTTNGTVALRACDGAARVLAGALLNLDAVAAVVAGAAELLLVCSGTAHEPALEDVLAAGLLAAAFPDAERTDATRLAEAVGREHRHDLRRSLGLSRNGRALVASGRAAEVDWCAQLSTLAAVGEMRGGVILQIA